ncbi:Myc-type [Macleaya cordata]|uniref:Myc-type n=1 Tax=Macleaya cordata TaxID=56857 RepID=A0A200QCJ4_MACCD|nr:Myc-type [Macleaya cordata]
MDSVFFLDEEARTQFLQTLAQAFGCTYLCLWSYYPSPSNHLFSLHGWFNVVNTTNEPSSSSHQGLVRTLFDAYRGTLYSVENGFVPGLAFKEGVPFLEVKELELLSRASTEIQRQFYRHFMWQSAVFMGCKSGEMEIGMSTVNQTANMEVEMMNWFPDDFSQHSKLRELPRRMDQNWPSSSSSSLRSLSVGSPEYSSLLLNMPSTSFLPEFTKQASIEQTIRPNSISVLLQPNQQILQAYNALGNIQFPNAESDDAAMTRAMLAVISSPASSSSSHQTRSCGYHLSQESGAFRNYLPDFVPNNVQIKSNLGGQHMLKRAIFFYKNMYMRKRIIEEQQVHEGSRPTSSQLHHKMSERKRREKLNDSFHALRSLLPSGSKKDKVSLLSNTRDYLTALKAEVSELQRKNRLLEARLAPIRGASSIEEAAVGGSSSSSRVEIQINQTSESTSNEREIELQVTVRGHCDFMELVSRLLEFLKQVIKDVSLEYMEGNTSQQSQLSTNPCYRVIFRLKIKGNQTFDESAFQEAIERVVADVAK